MKLIPGRGDSARRFYVSFRQSHPGVCFSFSDFLAPSLPAGYVKDRDDVVRGNRHRSRRIAAVSGNARRMELNMCRVKSQSTDNTNMALISRLSHSLSRL